jgi:phage-related protein
MTLKKQSIRSSATISVDGKIPTKDELIEISETWSENQEIFFRKMLQQGGSFTLKGKQYKVLKTERTDLDSNGNKPFTTPPLPGERTF